MIQSNLPSNYKSLITPILQSNYLKVIDQEINRIVHLIAKDLQTNENHYGWLMPIIFTYLKSIAD